MRARARGGVCPLGYIAVIRTDEKVLAEITCQLEHASVVYTTTCIHHLQYIVGYVPNSYVPNSYVPNTALSLSLC